MSIFISVLTGINSVLGNYGWSVMVFTLLVRILLFPFDYKSRVGMRRTTQIQPEIQRLQKKYANDKDKLNQKMAELYKKEKINPMSSCLPLLLSYPILIMMFNAMREVAQEQTLAQVISLLQHPDQMPVMESWLWVKNVWMPDSPFSSALPDLNMLRQVSVDSWNAAFSTAPQVWADLFANNEILAGAMAKIGEDAKLFSTIAETGELVLNADLLKNNSTAIIQAIASALSATPIYQQMGGALPGWNFNLLIANFSIMKDWNGLYLLPLLSAGSQFLMTKLTPAQPNANADTQQQSTANFMTWFFPLFSLWICSSYNGMFALYWVTSNLVMMAQTWGINKFLDAKDKKAAVAGEGTVK